MLNQKISFWISILGVFACTARLVIENEQQFETIAAIFLFLLNAQAIEVFLFYQRKIAQKTEQKNFQLDDKVTHLEDDLRKLNLALSVKGVLR